jgi:Cu2+-exporting ATPase
MVIFDKTGALTRGSRALSGVATSPGSNESDLLALATAVEANSEHPLAQAIVAEDKRRNLPTLQAADFEALPGRGAHARVNGKSVMVGGPCLLTEGEVTVPPEVEELTTAWASEGKTVLYVVAEGGLLGAFDVEDAIRPESREAATELHRLGIGVIRPTETGYRLIDYL